MPSVHCSACCHNEVLCTNVSSSLHGEGPHLCLAEPPLNLPLSIRCETWKCYERPLQGLYPACLPALVRTRCAEPATVVAEEKHSWQGSQFQGHLTLPHPNLWWSAHLSPPEAGHLTAQMQLGVAAGALSHPRLRHFHHDHLCLHPGCHLPLTLTLLPGDPGAEP